MNILLERGDLDHYKFVSALTFCDGGMFNGTIIMSETQSLKTDDTVCQELLYNFDRGRKKLLFIKIFKVYDRPPCVFPKCKLNFNF